MQQTLASLYKRKGKNILDPKDLELLASLELRWFEPNDARRLVEIALNLGLLEETAEGIKPKFDYVSMEIPFGFRPPKDLISSLEQENESLFMQIVNHICLKSGLDQNQVIADINSKQTKSNDYFKIEAIAILYAKENGVDVDDFIPKVKEYLLSM
jgi:hypothetical protein